jgi:hypothetical protein
MVNEWLKIMVEGMLMMRGQMYTIPSPRTTGNGVLTKYETPSVTIDVARDLQFAICERMNSRDVAGLLLTET